MCGIAGFVDQKGGFDATARLEVMGQAIAYRGPDDFGVYFDSETGLGFVHRRLAIVDLTSAGHQPAAGGRPRNSSTSAKKRRVAGVAHRAARTSSAT